jgi:transcriptional regulator GlxA family with amidase domain
VCSETVQDPLAVEECVLHLLERVLRSAYTGSHDTRSLANRPQRCDIIHDIEAILSQDWNEPLTIREIAGKVGLTPYHVCRLFRSATGTTLHQYRQRLRLRGSLESVIESRRLLVDIALDSGFASHSHFTSAFHREFAETPSAVRDGSAPARRGDRNFVIAPLGSYPLTRDHA